MPIVLDFEFQISIKRLVKFKDPVYKILSKIYDFDPIASVS